VVHPPRALIFTYLGTLLVLMTFARPYIGFIDIPISFFIKNKLHLSAEGVAEFRLIAGIPLYLSFVFGFVRDTFNPFGLKDRGFLLLFGGLGTVLYLGFMLLPVSNATVLTLLTATTMAMLFVAAGQAGLSAVIGKQLQMSGQVAAVWQIAEYVPMLAGFFLGGYVSDQLEGNNATRAAHLIFLMGAAAMAAIALFGLWHPKRIFARLHGEEDAPPRRRLSDIRRLVNHWPFYPAMAIWFLWSFAPGYNTPLQFYLQNTLHASDAAYADWYTIFVAGFVPFFILFGWLCRRFSLRTLLFWGTLVAVPQAIPLFFIHTVTGSLIAAAAMGAMGGVATAAYIDLIIRSSPDGLEGTTVMMSGALYYIAVRFGDVLGTWLYSHFGGFGVCIVAITVVYALMVPILFTIPRRITEPKDI
jgi:predicted MFS family arabinose efflux permease